MAEYGDIRIAYGASDEFSFVIHKSASLYGDETLLICMHVP